MDTAVEPDVSVRAVAALLDALGDRLVAVVLFGSRARGDAHAGSDWDLLVIARGLSASRFERCLEIQRILPVEFRGAVSVLAKTPEEFTSHLPSLYLDVALDGQILYDPHGFAADRLASLKRTMDRAGLYRERTADGDVWRWRKQPSGHWSLQWETA